VVLETPESRRGFTGYSVSPEITNGRERVTCLNSSELIEARIKTRRSGETTLRFLATASLREHSTHHGLRIHDSGQNTRRNADEYGFNEISTLFYDLFTITNRGI